jgi:hypothetical protein
MFIPDIVLLNLTHRNVLSVWASWWEENSQLQTGIGSSAAERVSYLQVVVPQLMQIVIITVKFYFKWQIYVKRILMFTSDADVTFVGRMSCLLHPIVCA